MRRTWWAALLNLAYTLLVLAPAILMAIRPAGREFWREVAVGLGFVGLSLMGLQLLPTARLRWVGRVLPLDVVYRHHHLLAILALALMLAHPLILFINNPYTLRLLNPFTAPAPAQAGLLATLLAMALVVSSVWRRPLGLRYEPWRLLHNLLMLGVVGLALGHAFGVGHYMGRVEQRVLWVGLIALWAALYAYLRVITPLLLLRRPYRVKEVRAERGSTWVLAIEPEGHRGLRFVPGQFAWLTIKAAPFGLREHPFSFSSSATRPEVLEFGIKEVGDFTSTIGEVKPGDRVYVDGPHGIFGSDGHPQAPAYVFVAGGNGVTPILSMLRTLVDRGDTRPLYLFYGNPTWDAVAYREELDLLQTRLNLHVVHVLEKLQEGDPGEQGFVSAEILDRHLPGERGAFAYFLCGPPPMLRAMAQAFRRLGLPEERIHVEDYEMA